MIPCAGAQTWFRRTVFVAGLGVILRIIVAFGLIPGMPQVEDGPNYSRQALQILDGTVGHFYFPPGTSLLAVPVYAVFGQSTWTDHLLGTALTSGFLIVGIWFCYVVMGWGKATFIGAVLLAVYPHSVLSATQLNSEPLTAIFLGVAVGLTVRNSQRWSWRRWLGVAVCLAGAALTRPASMAVLVMLGIGGMILWKRRRISFAVLACASAITIVVLAVSAYPVTAHNARHGQGWTISTNNEFNLFVGNTPHTPDYRTGEFGQRPWEELSAEENAYLRTFLPHGRTYQATQEERETMRRAAVDYMLRHPIRTLYRVTNRARVFWGMDYTAARGIQHAYGLADAAVLPLLAVEGGFYTFFMLLVITAPFLASRESRKHWIFIIGFVAALMLPYLLAFAVPKYHLPAVLLLTPIAATAGAAIHDAPKDALLTMCRSPLWWTAIVAFCVVQAELVVRLTLVR